MTPQRVLWLGRLSGLAFFALVVVLAFWKAIFYADFTLVSGGDMTTQIYPWFNIAAHWLKRGTLLLWDPYVFAGKANLGELQSGTLYPLYWLCRLLPPNPQGMHLAGVQLFVLLHHFLAGYFTFLLGRSLGLRPAGAAVAGIAFPLSGFFAFLYTTANIFAGSAWMPLFFLLFRKTTEARAVMPWRLMFWSAVVLAVSVLPGHHAPAVHMGLLVFFFTLFKVATHWKTARLAQRLAWVAQLAIVAVIAALLDAVQLLPSAEWARHVWRWIGEPEPVRWGQSVSYAVLERTLNLHPQDLLSLVLPYASTSHNLYMGAAIVFLALIGVLFAHEREAQFFGLAAFAFLFIASGRFSTLHGWIYTFVPGIWFARETYLYLVPFSLCLALCAGYGLHTLLEVYGRTSPDILRVFIRRAGWGLAAVVAACWILIGAGRIVKAMPMEHPYLAAAAELSIYLALLGTLLFLLHVGRIQAGLFGTLVAGLTLLDLTSRVSSAVPAVTPAPGQKESAVERVWRMPPAAQFLRSLRQNEVFRVADHAEAFPLNFGDGWRLEETMGSSATGLVKYYEFRDIGWGPASNASALLNARYFLSRTPVPGMPKVFAEGNAVYRNPRAVPRAFVASRYRVIAEQLQILDWMQSPLFSPRETVILSESEFVRLGAEFAGGLSREGEGIQTRPIRYVTSAERERDRTVDPEQREKLTLFRAPWGWSEGDDLELALRAERPLEACYLIVRYYPTASSNSRVDVRVEGAGSAITFPLVLSGRGPETPPDDALDAVARFGPVGAGEHRLSFQRTAECSANLDSVRVETSVPAPSREAPVSVRNFAPNRIRLAADLPRPGLVVLSEVYYPGWKAWVDGNPAPVLEANYLLRAVPVPAGKHEVVLRFRSRPVEAGFAITLATLLAPALIAFYRRSRGRTMTRARPADPSAPDR
jgi:hypothetical protein